MDQPTQPRESTAIAFGLGAVVLWSTVATGFKLGLAVLAVEQLLLLGSTISWFVFLGAVVWQGRLQISGKDLWLAVALGVINPWAYYLVLFAAYDRLPAHIAQPLNYTWAITLALLAVPLLGQALTKRSLLGIFVSYAGVVALLNLSSASDGAWDAIGIALALASTVLWALYWLANTRSESDPASMMFVSFSVGVPLVFATCVYGPGLPELSATTLSYGAWIGLVEMGVTFLLWQRALKLTHDAARMGQLIFLSPFLSLLLIHYFLGEDITLGAVASLVVIVLGIVIARRRSP